MIRLNEVLDLTRPLAVLDTETTGTSDELDRIVQISIKMHYPKDTGKDPISWKSYVYPGVPIPPESTEIHGITDAMVATAPRFADMAQQIAGALSVADFAGHSIKFDLRMVTAEMRRASVKWDWQELGAAVIDTLRIRQMLKPNDLSTCYREVTGVELEAHDAGHDVEATEVVLADWLVRWATELPRDVRALHHVCWAKPVNAVDEDAKFTWRFGKCCVAFGKHNGKPLNECLHDVGYWRWVAGLTDRPSGFTPEIRFLVKEALAGRIPERSHDRT